MQVFLCAFPAGLHAAGRMMLLKLASREEV